MRTALLIFFLSLSFIVSAQNSEIPKPDSLGVYDYKDVKEKPTSAYNISDYLAKNLHYPVGARDSNKQGRVLIKFRVDKEGYVRDAFVLVGFNVACNAEALRVVREMPRWKPAKINNEFVDVYFTMPISFKLE